MHQQEEGVVGGAGGPTWKAKRPRTTSSSIKSRTTVKQTKQKKDEACVKGPLHLKIICMVDLDTTPGEYDEVDFDIGDVSQDTFPRYVNRRAAVVADATGKHSIIFFDSLY